MKHVLARCCAVAVLLLAGSAHGAVDSLDASIRQVEQAITPQRNGEHLNLLFALRQLQAPALRPLFYKLVQHDEWAVQVHAVLGLAELSDEKHVDPWLVRQMNPAGHELLIANAIDLDLLHAEQMRELIRHDELGSMARLLLLAELTSMGENVPMDQLQKLADHADFNVGALASAVLMQLGDASKFSTVRERLTSMPARERGSNLQWLFEAIRQYNFTKLAPWVKEALAADSIDEPVEFAGVFALAALGDPDVLGYWTSGLGAQPRHAQQIRYALILLVCADTVPAAAFDQLPTGDALLSQIASTGRAIQSGQNVVHELKNLLDLQHRKSTDLVMPHVEQLPDDQAADVYAHLIDRLATPEGQSAETITVAVRATGELLKLAPDMALSRLAAAEDDSVHQQTILLGLMDSHRPAIGAEAAKVRRIGAGRADSLVLLLMAKNLQTLDDDALDQLGLIASGGGRVSAVLQTQAAWLYVQHTNNVEKALGRLFPGS